MLEISSFYTCVPKIKVIWSMVPEIQSGTDIFCHFGPFFALPPLCLPKDPKNQNFEKKLKKCLEALSFYGYMSTINVNHMIYGSWNIRCDREKFLSFWAIFCPFTPLTTWKIKILKLKKTPGDIIILQICTINDNLLVYGSWDMKHDWQNFFCHFGAFLPFYPTNNLKSQNFEKLKKISGDIIILHKCTKNHYHRLYCSLGMACNVFNCYFSFWTIFCPFTFLTAQKIKI